MKHKSLLPLFFILVSSCMVGPNYKTPKTHFGESFIEKKETSKAPNTDLSQWWKGFHDPLLDDYIEQALAQNYDIEIAWEKIQELRALYNLKADDLYPKIDATGQARKLHVSKNLFGANSPTIALKKIFQVGFDASWELDFFGKIRRSKQAALNNLQATTEEMRNVQITIMSEVARLYVEARSLQNKIQLTEKQIQALKTLYQLTYDKYQSGLADKRDVEKAKAAWEKRASTLPLLIAEKKKSTYSLAFFLSSKMETIQEDFKEVRSVPNASGKIPDFLPSDLLQRRPDIRQSERELASQTAKIGVAKADLFPQFSLTGSFSYLSQKASNWFQYDSRNWYVGPDLKWPILYFGRIRANIRMETAKQKQAFTHYEKTVLNAVKEVETSLAEYFNQEESKKNTMAEVASVKKQTSLQKDLYKSGLTDYSSLLSLQVSLYESEKALIESQSQIATKLIALYKALGGDWSCSSMP